MLRSRRQRCTSRGVSFLRVAAGFQPQAVMTCLRLRGNIWGFIFQVLFFGEMEQTNTISRNSGIPLYHWQSVPLWKSIPVPLCHSIVKIAKNWVSWNQESEIFNWHSTLGKREHTGFASLLNSYTMYMYANINRRHTYMIQHKCYRKTWECLCIANSYVCMGHIYVSSIYTIQSLPLFVAFRRFVNPPLLPPFSD